MPAQTVNGAILPSSTEAGAVWTDTTLNIGSTTGPVSFFALAYVPGTSSTVSVTDIKINGLTMTLEADRSMLADFGEQGRHRAARLDGASVSGALSVQVTKSSTTLGRPIILLCWSDQSAGVVNIAFVPTMSGASVSATVASNANSQAALLGWFYSSVSITPTAPTVIPQNGSTPAMAFLPGSTELRIGALAEPGAASSVLQATLSHLYLPSSIGWVGSFAGASTNAAPTMNGAITAGAVTSSSISYSWPAASDDGAVASYERSLDGGTTWLDIGNVLTRTDTGLAASTAFQVRVRAKDAPGLVATTPLAASISTTAAGGPTTYTLVCSRMANNTGAGKKVSTTFTGTLVYGGDFNDLAGKTLVAVGSTAVDANGDATIAGLPQTGAAMLLRKWADGARSAEFVTVA
jgi:hypothetical protein